MVTARVWIAIALAFGLVLLVWTLSSCEPCAVVLGGHCYQEHEDEFDHQQGTEPLSLPPPPLSPYYTPHQRG